MLDDPWHPTPNELARFAGKDLSPADTRRIGRHLDLCLNCRWQLDELLSRATGALFGRQGSEIAYDRAIERAVENVTGPLATVLREADGAPLLLAELLRRPEGERRRMIREEERFRAVKLCQLLQKKSRDAWHNDPAMALELSELAVGVADRLDPSRYSTSLVEDAQAMAWAYLGNSYRVASDFLKAEEAFRIAFLHHSRAGEDALTEGEILSFLASLRVVQGRFGEAFSLLGRTLTLWRESEDRVLEGNLLIKKGLIFVYSGRTDEAVVTLERALALGVLSGEPYLTFMAQHNLSATLIDRGLLSQAHSVLDIHRPLYDEIGSALDRVRFDWLKARIDQHSGHLDEARGMLRKVRKFFTEHGLGVQAAFINLDLAFISEEQGRSSEVRRLAEEIIPIFDVNQIHPLAFTARLLYERATRR